MEPPTLSELYTYVLEELDLQDDQIKEFTTRVHDDKPHAINVIHTHAGNLTSDMVLELEEYIVRKQDMERIPLYKIVFLVNMLDGPVVLKDAQRGYGLFAERNYAPLEGVTYYGGDVFTDKPVLQGDYVIRIPKEITNKPYDLTIDGRDGFLLSEKGRWVNEFARNKAKRKEAQNINTKWDEDEDRILFGTQNQVLKGQQFFWDYGEEGYDRRMYAECQLCGMKTWRMCPMLGMPFCNVECRAQYMEK